MATALWTPSPERVATTRMAAFQAHANARHGANATDWPSLYNWSIEAPEAFWQAVAEFTEVRWHDQPSAVLADRQMPGARWFPDGTLNFAAHLLRFAERTPDAVALVAVGEDGRREQLSFAELRRDVARMAHRLRDMGIEPGDRVAGFLPNRPEAVVAMLAAASVGAVWSSCSPDFGINGVLDRFGQIAPRVLLTADGYFYNGKAIDCLQRVAGLLPQLPSVERLLVVPYAGSSTDPASLQPLGHGGAVLTWADWLDGADERFEALPLPVDHPLYIMYSSGTTGVPKCIVHCAGGTLLQHLKEHVLHTDLGPDDTLFYFTTCGWMMWNWLVSGLATGASLVLFDGNPFFPGPERLLDLIDAEGITVFGTSAKYIAALEKEAVVPRDSHDLGTLKAVLSTGSPLAHESFRYVYRDWADDLCLSSITGGTDLISCFALGNPVLPVYEGQIQCRGLGMDVAFVDDDGQPLLAQKGELVCRLPFPTMPVGFWNDPDGEKYHSAYFARFPGLWAHGDWGELTAEGGVIIHGRSDAVLNPGGVRIGTAEIYRQVEKVAAVREALVIGQDHDDDVRVVLFVVLQPGEQLSDALRTEIRQTIRANATPRHVPAVIAQVPDIPRTISGKITELAVREMVHGRPVKNTDALANPEALEHFRAHPDLKD